MKQPKLCTEVYYSNGETGKEQIQNLLNLIVWQSPETFSVLINSGGAEISKLQSSQSAIGCAHCSLTGAIKKMN